LILVEHPDRRVRIDGFTDSVGTDSYNEEVSQQRAVREALVYSTIAILATFVGHCISQ